MEFKKGKWIRQSKAAAILLLAGAMLLAVYGSFAAYTNFNSVKRVVSTGTQSDTMFGSNYLSLMGINDTNIPVKRISLAESSGAYTFTVQVCNYVWGDESLYNPRQISYTMTAELISMDGGPLPEGCTGIKMKHIPFDTDGKCNLGRQTLDTGDAKTNEYKIEIPTSLKDKIKIKIIAKPEQSSEEAVNFQKLAAILLFADYEVNKNWTGHFIDSQTHTPDDYDAFNYEISGNGAGTVTVKWDDSLLLSKWATNDKQQNGSYTFNVDGSATAIQFQFYKNPEKWKALEGWEALENLVTVEFKEQNETETK